MAMARSFDLLTKSDWRSGDLREVITECSKPFCESDRIRLTGPAVVLPPKAMVGMGMIIHELATNATKYGAFSTSQLARLMCNWDDTGRATLQPNALFSVERTRGSGSNSNFRKRDLAHH